MSAYELKTFLDEVYEATGVTHTCDFEVTLILDYCIDNFSDNISVANYNKRVKAARESTNILQGEDDESISLGKRGIFHLHHPHVIITLKLNML